MANSKLQGVMISFIKELILNNCSQSEENLKKEFYKKMLTEAIEPRKLLAILKADLEYGHLYKSLNLEDEKIQFLEKIKEIYMLKGTVKLMDTPSSSSLSYVKIKEKNLPLWKNQLFLSITKKEGFSLELFKRSFHIALWGLGENYSNIVFSCERLEIIIPSKGYISLEIEL